MQPTFQIINTCDTAVIGPRGNRYIHDAARPFAVLFKGMCCMRYPTEQGAKVGVMRFEAARQRYANRNAVEPRTAAGSLD